MRTAVMLAAPAAPAVPQYILDDDEKPTTKIDNPFDLLNLADE